MNWFSRLKIIGSQHDNPESKASGHGVASAAVPDRDPVLPACRALDETLRCQMINEVPAAKMGVHRKFGTTDTPGNPIEQVGCPTQRPSDDSIKEETGFCR
jgi:hypothetical protein